MPIDKPLDDLNDLDEDNVKDLGDKEEYVIVDEPIKPKKEKNDDLDEDDDDEDHDDADESDNNDEDSLKKEGASEDKDEEASLNETEKERTARNKRNRIRRIDKKRRQELFHAAHVREIEILRQHNEELERRLQAQEEFAHRSVISEADKRIFEAQKKIEDADNIMARAISSQNGEDYQLAQRFKELALREAQEAMYLKQQQQNAALERQSKPRIEPINPIIQDFGKKFLEDNPWYQMNADVRDKDSNMVNVIDNNLMAEGYDPTKKEYWDELRARARKKLPHKFQNDNDDDVVVTKRKPTGGPNVGSSRDHAPVTTKREIYISADRRKTLEDMGIWDNPTQRDRYIRAYAKHDREQSKKG